MTQGKPEKLDNPEAVGLPATPFFYHLDQVASMLQFSEDVLISSYIWFLGRSRGRNSPRQIRAVNVAVDPDGAPEWRVSEGELVRWMKLQGFRVYSRGRVV